MEEPEPQVTRINGYLEPLEKLLAVYGLGLERVGDTDPVPGSFWGEPEAGLIGNRLYVRRDTPLHSAFHEACHYICMDENRRRALDTNAGGSVAEENGVCYLQILLADTIDGVGRDRLMSDMDAWGYSFRLGSTRAWFEQDAGDARAFLEKHELIDHTGAPTWQLRS